MKRALLIVLAAVACERAPEEEPPHEVAAPARERVYAIAVLQPTAGNHVHGTVRFTETSVGVTVDADISGLDPHTQHGFHVHELGDCSAPDAESAMTRCTDAGLPALSRIPARIFTRRAVGGG